MLSLLIPFIKIDNTQICFKYFQIKAEKIQVLAEPMEDDAFGQSVDDTEPKTESSNPSIIDDFAVYTARKRTATKMIDERSPKKKKTTRSQDKSAMDAD
jgi:hypothetical protein